MNYAIVDRSKRLLRVLGVLSDCKEHSTWESSRRARVCAVNSCCAELRAQGHNIVCDSRNVRGDRVWFYRIE